MRISRLPALALLALLPAACVPRYVPPYPLPAPAAGLFWSGGGWSVTRLGAPPGFYCSATHDSFGPDLAFVAPAGGPVGWNLANPSPRAQPGGNYPVLLRFSPGPALRFTAELHGDNRLADIPQDEGAAAQLARAAGNARDVTVSSPVLGPLGRYSLAGSGAALDALQRCASGGM
jgi:hypothetical protein